MAVLEKIFELFNGTDIEERIESTMVILESRRKEYYHVSGKENVDQIREKLYGILKPDLEGVTLSDGQNQVSYTHLTSLFETESFEYEINRIRHIKSELLNCIDQENFEAVKRDNEFWQHLENVFHMVGYGSMDY